MGLLPDKEREILRKEFADLAGVVTLEVFGRESRIELPAGAEPECQYCKETRQLYEEIGALSDKMKVSVHDFLLEKEPVERYNVARVPALVLLDKDGADVGVRFYGIPAGYEFASLVEGIRAVAGKPTPLKPETVAALKALANPVTIEAYVTPTCPYCPAAVHMGHLFAIASGGRVAAEMIEAQEFPDLSARNNVSSVPKVIIRARRPDGEKTVEFVGALPEEEYLAKVLEAAG